MPDSTTRFPARTEIVRRRDARRLRGETCLRADADQTHPGSNKVHDALRRHDCILADGVKEAGAAA